MIVGVHSVLAEQLPLLEKALREAGLWESQTPSSEALSSTLPFAVDRMAFHQWLQFLFLPRMQQLVAMGAALPGDCAIAPMAEEYLKGCEVEAPKLIFCLLEIDRLLSGADS